MREHRLAKRHVVLLGVGHTNAHIVRQWRESPYPDADLTCISDHAIATYSGLMPAVLAGQQPPTAMQIDLVKFCGDAGATLLTDRVTGLNLSDRELLFDSRPPVPYDVLSVGIGSRPSMKGVAVQGDRLLTIKPMQTFLPRLESAIQRATTKSTQPLSIAVVGGGVAGVEISLCLPARLKTLGVADSQIRLISRGDAIPSETLPRLQQRLRHAFQRQSIEVVLGHSVVGVSDQGITLDDERQLPADIVLWATGATAPPLLKSLSLPVDDHGFLLTDNTLQSVSGEPIFAVGDSGTIRDGSVPKAGVYAVRQGPVLWDNLRRCLEKAPLLSYVPQRSFMRLINLGTDEAVGQWKGFTFGGKWVLRLKHRIDMRFMNMHEPMSPMSDNDMQCDGCGCKLGSAPLQSALRSVHGADVAPEDAVPVLGTSSRWFASTDFFSAPFRDPYLVGRITALHSASDLIASGASVRQAIANVVIPHGDQTSQERMLVDFTKGASAEFSKMGAEIVGGHTIVGPRFEAGFTVFGELISRRIEKGNLRAGDQLFLTRPIGIGVLLAASMRNQCPADVFMPLLETMLTSQSGWGELAAELEIVGGTDVTGFGLAGHLIEMLRASGVSATVRLSEIPVLAGAVDLSQSGIQSSLAPDNYQFETSIRAEKSVREDERYPLLFDPQTCGGLLLAVPQNLSQQFTRLAAQRQLPQPFWIGQVGEQTDRVTLLLER